MSNRDLGSRSLKNSKSFMGGSRGGQGVQTSPPPKKKKLKGFLAILVRIPEKSHSYQASFQCWATIDMPLKWCFPGGPMMAHLYWCSDLLSPLIKKTPKVYGSGHVIDQCCIQANLIKICRLALRYCVLYIVMLTLAADGTSNGKLQNISPSPSCSGFSGGRDIAILMGQSTR